VRKIFFFEDFAVFQCRKAVYRDDIIHHKSSKPPNLLHLREAEGAISPDDFMWPRTAFQKVVETYSKRELRYPNDIINAFAGILRYFGQLLETEMCCGMPKLLMAHSLCWKISSSCRSRNGRREGFPSWSWCGWACSVSLTQLIPDSWDPHIWTEFEVWQIHDEPETQLEQVSAEINLFPATEVKDQSLQREVAPSKITWCLTFYTITTSLKVGKPFREAQTTGDDPDVLAYRILDKNDEECGRIQLLSTWTSSIGSIQEFVALKDSTFGQEYRSETNRTACLKYNKPRADDEIAVDAMLKASLELSERPYYIVLMVVPHSGSVSNARERVGIGLLYKGAMLRSCGLGTEWKKVKLV
jgi:hypothetical protein